MRSPGIEVRPLREANGGYLFNEVFLTDVFVPDSRLVGNPGEGWRLARTTLGNERANIATGLGRRQEMPSGYLPATGEDPVPAEVLAECGVLTAALGGPPGEAAHGYLSLPPTLLGGGTLEIQLNVIAEQVLGLPR